MPFIYVADPAGLSHLSGLIARARRVAFDTEANSLYRYTPRVCLIQLNVRGRNYIVDPLADVDLRPLLDALLDKVLVIHDGDYDMRMLRSEYGIKPKGKVFDTKLAAQLLGYESFGLVAMVEQVLGVSLTKQGQKSNWTRRPLTEAQLLYACDDTRYLLHLADKLEAELRHRGRLGWHEESCARMVRATTEEPPKKVIDPWRIRGAGDLNRHELGILREVWHWRDREARRADRPAFKVMLDGTLLELAQRDVARRSRDLRSGPRLPSSCKGGRLAKLEKALALGRALAKDELPPARRPGPVNRARNRTSLA